MIGGETPPATPFSFPDRVMPRLNLEKFLNDLRTRIPPGYMPSAQGVSKVTYASKPEYSTTAIETYIEKNESGIIGSYGSGYYANDTGYPHMNADTGIYAALHVGEFILLCHLQSDKCWVRTSGIESTWERWQPTDTLPVDIVIYADVLECYL